MHTDASSPRQCRVAVVGAGAAGLVAARELRREGHEVAVFEQQPQLGGTWLYTDEVESDLSARDPKRRRVHSSMYQGLTTNLPREIMGFSDFPFSTAVMMGSGRSSIDGRRFPCSEEVLLYLQAFADRFHLQELVRFSTEVVRAVPVSSTAAHQPSGTAATTQQQPHQQQQQADPPNLPLPWQRWQVTWRELGAAGTQPNSSGSSAAASTAAAGGAAYAPDGPAVVSTEHTELFDALLICNGHYTEPNVPDILGAAGFPGVLMHSHNYRRADRFRGQHVAVIGPSYSGRDIARLVSQEAAQVYLCAREWRTPEQLAGRAVRGCSNVQRRGMISRLTAAGGAEFAVGQNVPQLDAVILCTGYNYSFPFLDLKALGLSVEQQHVEPVYQHMFPPGYAPGLAFIGLPWRVVPFPLFELQAKLCARLLSQRCSLPCAEVMADAVQQHAAELAAQGVRPEQSHCLDHRQLHYHAWLAGQCGPDVSRLPNWRAVVLHGALLLRWLYLVVTRWTSGQVTARSAA